MVYFCYIDESGTPEVPGNTSHYVLAGLAIPISKWKYCENGITRIKKKYDLEDSEIHTGWIARKYLEQSRIVDFEFLSKSQRIYEVQKLRKIELLTMQKNPSKKNTYKQAKKNYKQTEAYIHLTYSERTRLLQDLSDLVGSWTFARLFAECIDKVHFDPMRTKQSVDEQSLEQIVSRFEQYMQIKSKSSGDDQLYGTLIHDNNETVSKKHTALMKKFHKHGTLFTSIKHIIETPFFVNSELTSLVQIADLCCFTLRRYFENNETDLFHRIENRIDRKRGKIVGVRHFTNEMCNCLFCSKPIETAK
jgi:hypothetical protein